MEKERKKERKERGKITKMAEQFFIYNDYEIFLKNKNGDVVGRVTGQCFVSGSGSGSGERYVPALVAREILRVLHGREFHKSELSNLARRRGELRIIKIDPQDKGSDNLYSVDDLEKIEIGRAVGRRPGQKNKKPGSSPSLDRVTQWREKKRAELAAAAAAGDE